MRWSRLRHWCNVFPANPAFPSDEAPWPGSGGWGVAASRSVKTHDSIVWKFDMTNITDNTWIGEWQRSFRRREYVGLASSRLYFVSLANSTKKEEGNWEDPEYKQCHIVLCDCSVKSRQDMANDGSEDKKCELLDRGSMYSLSGAQLSKIKTGTKKIHPCTFRVPRVMEGKFIFRRADVNKHLQATGHGSDSSSPKH